MLIIFIVLNEIPTCKYQICLWWWSCICDLAAWSTFLWQETSRCCPSQLRALVNQLVGHRQHAFHLIIPSCLLLMINCKKQHVWVYSQQKLQTFRLAQNSPQASPSGDWQVIIISDPASWHLVYHCHRFDFTNVLQLSSQLFHNHYQWLSSLN